MGELGLGAGVGRQYDGWAVDTTAAVLSILDMLHSTCASSQMLLQSANQTHRYALAVLVPVVMSSWQLEATCRSRCSVRASYLDLNLFEDAHVPQVAEILVEFRL